MKDIYVTIFCIGVTNGINEQLLRSVSTHNDYTYITDTFTTLSRIQAHVAEKSCADRMYNFKYIYLRNKESFFEYFGQINKSRTKSMSFSPIYFISQDMFLKGVLVLLFVIF